MVSKKIGHYPFKNWALWTLGGLFYLYEFMYRLSPSVMIAELMQDFNASAYDIGMLSAAYFYAYAFCQIPVGFLLDRFTLRWLLSSACLLVAGGSFLFSIADNLFMAYVARILIGTGSAFGFGVCLKISTALFEARHFAVLVGLTNLIGIVGALIGGHPWAYWVQEYGWRPTLKNAAIIGAILSIALNIGLKNVGHSPSQIIKKPFDIKKIIPLLTHPQIWLIAFYGCCMVAPIAAFSELWGPVFLMQKYQIDRLQAASITSSTFIGIAIGGPLIGYISAYVKRKKLFMLLGSLGSLSSILLAIYLPPIPLITLSFLYFLFGLSSSTMLLCFSLNSALVPTPNQGAVIGLTNTIVMAGSVLSQPLIGYLLQSSATGKFTTENFQNAFLLLPICQFIAVLLWYRIKEPLSRL